MLTPFFFCVRGECLWCAWACLVVVMKRHYNNEWDGAPFRPIAAYRAVAPLVNIDTTLLFSMYITESAADSTIQGGETHAFLQVALVSFSSCGMPHV